MLKFKHIGLIIFYLTVFICCVYLSQLLYRTNIYPDKQTIKSFKSTPIFLLNKQLSINEGLIQGYRADFLITYHVNGVQYNRWVSGNGLDMSYDWNKAKQEAILAKFHIGKTYASWYDPQHPQLAMLMLRHDWRMMFFVAGIMLLGFFTFYAGLKVLLSGFTSLKMSG